ncbi:MAG: ribonuclease HII [Nevskia sp.]|nr:ribonuclease HII [Nevskia sp.]
MSAGGWRALLAAAAGPVAGVDEVGRGCLAGPVFAAAVVLPAKPRLRGLRDSKRLSARQREALAPQIQALALGWALGSASVEEIDSINILRASLLAMARAVAALPVAPVLCLVDGNQPPRLDCAVHTVVGGDDLVECIMAASIVAKVARDAEMARLDALHPGYGLGAHKGYATPEHLAALRRRGPCGIHRRSFAPCAQLALPGIGSGESAIANAMAGPAFDDSRFPIHDSHA